ncbi:glycosyl hydrolase [Sphingobacteriaceae bacterium]|nr:glycosyl hydrolase [Sphingobacteriaceae bacterium]
MAQVKVSICIPVYNGAKYISEAINSVLNQTFQDFEIIILDNKSTDNSVAVVKNYTDPRIKLFQNESNLGMLGNWNKILTLATGEYIKLLPADDAIYPDCLKLQCEILDQDKKKEISLVSGRKNIVNAKGKIIFSRGFSKKRIRVSKTDAVNKNIRSGGNIIGEPGVVLFRKELLEVTGVFDASIYYTMDLDLWFRMLLHGDLFVIPDNVCIFRVSNESESTKIINRQKTDQQNFIRKVFSAPEYQLTKFNYRVGLFAVVLSTFFKKILYKFILN